MRYMSEEESSRLVSHELAYEAVRAAFVAAASPQASLFPVVVAHGADPDDGCTVKSGSSRDFVGVKIGSYWPGNDRLQIPRHGTTIVLLDPATGRVAAVVEAAKVNAYRTAAADAVAADVLARPDASVLAVFGTGHQALYECAALARIRALDEVLVVSRSESRAARFAEQLQAQGLPARSSTADAACRAADVITTATTSTSPLFEASWVKEGTHVSSMGSDSRGKQELPVDLLRRGKLFCDFPPQSTAIGEFQHVAQDVVAGTLTLRTIGSVLTGVDPGRENHEDITVFDSSGIALKDLAVATALLAASASSPSADR
jgi:ornithine cyclodeaminase